VGSSSNKKYHEVVYNKLLKGKHKLNITIMKPMVFVAGVNISAVNWKALCGVGRGFVSFRPGHTSPEGV
jgi:hypothetical protein